MFIKKNKFKNLIVDKNKTIKDVLISLNKSSLPDKKMCIITCKSKVLNVLTDGDVRRIMINQKNLDEKISKYLQKKFIYGTSKETEIELNNKLKKYKIDFIPVLDKKKKLISIFYKDYIFNNYKKKYSNEVFILAGGRGKRMFPLTDFTPKPLLNIGKETILETLITLFKNQGFFNFTISVNYMSEQIINYIKEKKFSDVNINFVFENKKLGTAGPLSKLKMQSNKPVIVVNGDIYTRLNFFELLNFHNKRKNEITIGSHFYNQEVPYGVIDNKVRRHEIIKEKPSFQYMISAGIYIINKKIIKKIKKNKFLNMNDLINYEFKKKTKIGIFPIHELWMDIGDHGSFINAQTKIDQEW